jgi:hypothetical protein
VGSCGTKENPRCCSTPPTYVPSRYLDCNDYDKDLDTYNGCPIPKDTTTDFWDENGSLRQLADVDAKQSCDNMTGGGCGKQNNCKSMDCEARWDYETRQNTTCRQSRNGDYKCGGNGACGDVPSEECGDDYVNKNKEGNVWGTNKAKNVLGWDTTISHTFAPVHPSKDFYKVCELQEPESESAKEACSITGVTSVGNAKLACRCDQMDACDLVRVQNTDAVSVPLDLRIEYLEMEDYETPGGDRSNGSTGRTINTRETRNLKVRFALADWYKDADQNVKDSAILYTRLIEVCAVNMALPGNPNPKNATNINSNQCITKRVDGDLSKITEEDILIPIEISADSQGPWTVQYQAINDVCNRTFDWAGPDDGNSMIGRFRTGGTLLSGQRKPDSNLENYGAVTGSAPVAGPIANLADDTTGKFKKYEARGNAVGFTGESNNATITAGKRITGVQSYCYEAIYEPRFSSYGMMNATNPDSTDNRPKNVYRPDLGANGYRNANPSIAPLNSSDENYIGPDYSQMNKDGGKYIGE